MNKINMNINVLREKPLDLKPIHLNPKINSYYIKKLNKNKLKR